jgi:D-glycero-D-manno-heptose 1,7-bisphosphate phosphatase
MNGIAPRISLIVLDRDGVINQDSDDYIKSAEEWVPIPGSLEAIARLYHAGYRIVIATNQSGLARGLFTIDDLNAMHRKLRRELSVLGAQVEAIFFCPHSPQAKCRCRKPMPGLFEDISRRLQVDLSGVPVVGDSLKDLQAASTVGAEPVLVLTGKGERTAKSLPSELRGVPVFPDLAGAVDALLNV